ncbi:MAG: OmpA family protein [Weeksellaceae bacterium]|nr:OmpA family protein [Weeksellaceae bacterium]MDX9704311.1 OmpA family protein [Weeksellaceae bacterium]
MKEKLQFLLVLLFVGASFVNAQEENNSGYKYYQPQPTKKFTYKETEFNHWYISAFAGGNVLQNSDLVSWGSGFGFNPGYDFQFQVTREITHAFGLGIMAQIGKTEQYAKAPHHWVWNKFEGKTKYHGISLMGDLNLSMLFRRIDNNSPFRWAAHLYGGVGFIGYTAERRGIETETPWETTYKVRLNDKSFFAQVGAGLRYKLNQRFDLELRAMYVMTGDEEFDASGDPFPGTFTLADVEEGRDDNMITLSLGLHYKIGKHKESLQWYDPLKTINQLSDKIDVENLPCADDDNDGVCNLYDKCPDTPEGMKVDGSGCPLDSDGDGVPDSIDECPTIPGPPTNNGCPKPIVEVSIGAIASNLSDVIQGIEFDYNKDVIRTVSYPKLEQAYYILEAHPDYKFYVEGHTDAAGSVDYNQDLSERRAASVVRYLVNKGIPSSQLVPRGKGKSELKHPECDPVTNCAPWKNLENRRVIFIPMNEIDNLEVIK